MAVKYCRIKKRIDFENLFRKSKTIPGKLVFFKVKKNGMDSSRFCVVVGLKIAKKAAIRNKTKRRIKEILRNVYPLLKPGFDIAIITKKEILGKKYNTIAEEINDLLKSAKIIEQR